MGAGSWTRNPRAPPLMEWDRGHCSATKTFAKEKLHEIKTSKRQHYIQAAQLNSVRPIKTRAEAPNAWDTSINIIYTIHHLLIGKSMFCTFINYFYVSNILRYQIE